MASNRKLADSEDCSKSIEIGTRHGTSYDPCVRDIVKEILPEKAKEMGLELRIEVDRVFIGDESKHFIAGVMRHLDTKVTVPTIIPYR